MGNVAHTPGPWHISAMHTETGNYLNDGGVAIASTESRVAVVDCWAKPRRGEGHLTKCPIRDANARLIAAAPDLLAACELALLRIDPDSARERNGKRPRDASRLEEWALEACTALRAVIAKASG